MKRILLAIFFIGLLTTLHAASFFSGYITYQHLNGNAFKVIFQITASCQGSKPGATMPLRISDSANKISRIMDRVSVRNITWNNPNTCNSQNNYGWELHTYESVIDFDTIANGNYKNACVVYLSSEMCCRSGSINTYQPGNGYVTCMMNRCLVNDNNGPAISHLKVLDFTINQTNYYNPIIMDTIDGDFLTFEMVNPLYGFNGNVTFNNTYSARYPLSPFCSQSGQMNCSKLPLSQPPRGLFFDTLNGNLIFTSTKANEVGSIVYKVKEYRNINGKKELIGFFYSDNWFTTGMGNTRPYISKGTLGLDFKVVAGDSLTIPIQTVMNDTFKTDSVVITCYNPIKGASYSITRKWRSEFSLGWRPRCEDIREELYIFYLYFIGNDYRRTDPQSIAFNVWVQPDLNLGNDTVICKNSTFSLRSNLVGKYVWNNSLSDTSATFIAQTPGTYKLQVDRNGCVVSDSITLKEISSLPDVYLGEDTVICNQSSSSEIHIAAPFSPYVTYHWNVQPNLKSSVLTFKDTGWVSVKGGNVCGEAQDSIHVSRMSSPTMSLPKDTLLCDVNAFLIDPLNSHPVSYLWNNGSLDSFRIVQNTGIYALQAYNACGEARDSIWVEFKHTPVFSLGADTTVCNGHFPSFDLSVLDASILWSNGNTAKAFFTSKAGVVWARASNVCGTVTDSIHVANVLTPTISLGPDTFLCRPFTFTLKSTCDQCDYDWNGNSSDSSFVTDKEGIYVLNAYNYCGSVSDTLEIRSDSFPYFSLPADTAIKSPFVMEIFPDKYYNKMLWSTGDTTPFIQVNSMGTYWLKQENRCGEFTDSMMISEKLGLDKTSDIQIKVFPVPCNDILHLQTTFAFDNFKIIAVDGKICKMNWIKQSDGYVIELSELSPGIYVLVLEKDHQFHKILFRKDG